MRPLAIGFGVALILLAAYTVRDPRWWIRWRTAESEYRFERTRIFVEDQQRWWGQVIAYVCWWAGLFFVIAGLAPT